MSTRYLERDALRHLLDLLVERGFELIGPTVRDGAIVLDRIDGVGDLPRGMPGDPGSRHVPAGGRGDDRLFAWAHGPDSGKRFLFPPRETIQTGTKDPTARCGSRLRRSRRPVRVRRASLLRPARDRDPGPGVPGRRPRVPRPPGAVGLDRRELRPRETCFCTSMETGRAARWASTSRSPSSRTAGSPSRSGTEEGAGLLDALATAEADDEQIAASSR